MTTAQLAEDTIKQTANAITEDIDLTNEKTLDKYTDEGQYTTVLTEANRLLNAGIKNDGDIKDASVYTLFALASIGHAWMNESTEASKLYDYLQTDEYQYECNGFCWDAIPEALKADEYWLDSIMKELNIAIAYVDDWGYDDKRYSYTIENDPDSTEHYRFAFLGDPCEDGDMRSYAEPLAPVAWSLIGLMGVLDKSWSRKVSTSDASDAFTGSNGYASFVLTPRD